LQRDMRYNHQSSAGITSAEAVEGTLKMMQLLMVWKIVCPWGFGTRIVLVEHDDKLVLNEAKLRQLYDKVDNMSSELYNWIRKYDDISKSTWLMHGNTALEISNELIMEKGYELRIDISGEVKDRHTIKPLWIDSERQVSSSMMRCSVLIYIVSLALQPEISMAVCNQCTNIELVSPVYFFKDKTCDTQFAHQLIPNSVMAVKLQTGMDQDTLGGALLYHLQKKEDTLIGTQLLVIWGYKSDRIYLHAWLIEHESTFDWDRNKLKKLYDVCDSRYDIESNMGRWLLDDYNHF
jgi:hypothetical protein